MRPTSTVYYRLRRPFGSYHPSGILALPAFWVHEIDSLMNRRKIPFD